MRTHIVVATTLLVLAGPVAHGLGSVSYGSESVPVLEYSKIPGLADTVNQSSRVCQWWINGDEHCYYEASISQLNSLLKEYSEIETSPLEVVRRPAIGAEFVNQTDGIFYNAELHWVRGLTVTINGLRPLELIVYIDNVSQLDALLISDKLRVLPPSDARLRLLDDLCSDEVLKRGIAAAELAATEPYTSENVQAIATLLSDENEWVRNMAARALARLGAHAYTALPEINAVLERNSRKDDVLKAIDDIENAPRARKLRRGERNVLEAIEAYCEARSLERNNSPAFNVETLSMRQ